MRMTQQQAERWARTRQKGRKRFVWVHGVLGWGLPMAITCPVLLAVFQGWERLPLNLPIALVLFPIGGYWFGAWMWRFGEQKYQQALQHGGQA